MLPGSRHNPCSSSQSICYGPVNLSHDMGFGRMPILSLCVHRICQYHTSGWKVFPKKGYHYVLMSIWLSNYSKELQILLTISKASISGIDKGEKKENK